MVKQTVFSQYAAGGLASFCPQSAQQARARSATPLCWLRAIERHEVHVEQDHLLHRL